MIELAHFQIVAAALFAIGLYGVLARKSAVLILMSIELILNAVNVNLIGFAAFVDFASPARTLGQVDRHICDNHCCCRNSPCNGYYLKAV